MAYSEYDDGYGIINGGAQDSHRVSANPQEEAVYSHGTHEGVIPSFSLAFVGTILHDALESYDIFLGNHPILRSGLTLFAAGLFVYSFGSIVAQRRIRAMERAIRYNA